MRIHTHIYMPLALSMLLIYMCVHKCGGEYIYGLVYICVFIYR